MPSLAVFCDRMRYWCDEGNLGYDQIERWNIWEGGECDCSSLVIHCLQEAGFDTGDAYYTGNLSDNLTARGWERLWPDISSAQPGDILLNDANHVAAVVDGYGWGATIGEAWLDETGGIYYGAAGDQTGLETRTRGIYDFPWDCFLRYAGEEGDDDVSAQDVWDYGIGQDATVHYNNEPAWKRLSWVHHDAAAVYKDVCRTDFADVEKSTGEKVNTGAGMHERLVYCEAYIKKIMSKLDKLEGGDSSVVSIDYDKLAEAVADKLAKRMAD